VVRRKHPGSRKVRVKLFSEEDRERWNRYVMESPRSTCPHLVEWKDVVEDSFRVKTYYLLAENEDNGIEGVLPLAQLKSVFFGNFMVSLPYLNFGGICSDGADAAESLLSEAIRIAKEESVDHIELRHTSNLLDWLPVKTAKVCMQLSLPNEQEELWSSFSSNLRRKVRKATKEGMYTKFGGEEELDNFYSVFSWKMRDLGTPVYSKGFFRNILKAFPGSTRICTVYGKEGQAVASGFLIGFKERLEIPWVSSLKRYDRYYVNSLLYWSSLKFACEKGYQVFDFGRSTLGEGTYKFKEQWGANAVQLYWHYWLRGDGPLPELNPKNPKYQLAIRMWKKLPIWLTKIIGPMIVKNLP
jgi:serine/alanine adding enzyme